MPREVEIRVVALARKILADEMGIVEGCRALVRLNGALDSRDERLFLPFIAVESETDHLPLGEARLLWQPEALARKEQAAEIYLEKVRGVLHDACRALIHRYQDTGT
jgi:hypothetical protein